MKQKSSFLKRLLSVVMAVTCVFGTIPVMSASAANVPVDSNNNGWGHARSNGAIVYNDSTGSSTKGSVSAGEGFTILRKDNNRYYINYSVSSANYKEGYVNASDVVEYFNFSSAGEMNTSTTTRYYHGTNSLEVGSVSAGEIVSVLARNNGYYYIEYNTTSVGRKRGWVPVGTLTTYSSDYVLYSHPEYYDNGYEPSWSSASHSKTVYRVPNGNKSSSNIDGSISAGEPIRQVGYTTVNGILYQYIEYYYGSQSNNIIKSGYIDVTDDLYG